MRRLGAVAAAASVLIGVCTRAQAPAPGQSATQSAPAVTASSYFDNAGRDDVLSGGVRLTSW